MNNKKILSIISLASVIGMNMQSIAQNIPQTNNTILLANRSASNDIQKYADSSSDSISGNVITINNVWNYNIGSLNFNPSTNKIEFTSGWNEVNPYLSKSDEAFSISLYKSNGQLIKSVKVYGDEQPQQQLSDAFNNLDFSYGDLLTIDYKRSSKISISNFNNEKDYQVKKPISMEITKNGLKEVNNNLTVDPIYYESNSNKINVSGKTTANTLVNIWVDNKDYTTTSNSTGEFNLNIVADKNITSSTPIEVFVQGEDNKVLNPILNPNIYKIQSSAIKINNGWGSPAGTISFNPVTMKMDVSGYNLFLGHNSNKFLTISTYSGKNGGETSSKSFNGNDNTNVLAKYIDGKSFEYGEIIGISYDSSQGKVSIINNSKNIGNTSGKSEFFEITKGGLKELSNNLTVNPIYIDLDSNKMNISGYATPNSTVNIWFDNKDYTTVANSKGEYDLEMTTDKNIIPNTVVNVFDEGNNSIQRTIQLNPNKYKLNYNSISLDGHWGRNPYLVSKITFNQYTKKLDVENRGNVYFSRRSGSPAYTISLLNKNGEVIKSEQYKGSGSSKNVYDDFNGLSFNYGDYIKIQSHGLDMSVANFDGQKEYNLNGKNNPTILYEITSSGLQSFNMPQVNIINKTISLSSYPNSKVNMIINGKEYNYKTDSNGNLKIEVPVNISENTPVNISVINENGVKTLPTNYYLNGSDISKEFTFNMRREASINPNNPIAIKGDCMPLTSFEPLGVQMLSKGKIKIDIKGNITGYATLQVNDGLREYINKRIPVNTPTIIDLPKGGGLILDTSNVMLKGGSIDTPFNFKVDLDTMNTPYREIPVFDNRTDVKMCSYATNNSQTFYDEINSGDNQNYGAVIIGNHIRMYMPKASFLGKDFNAQQTVKTYNDTFISDNELNGLSPDAKDQLNRFHTNFFYVTAQYPPIGNGGAWFTNGNGTWTVPALFPGCLTEPGWVLFHEVGHIFDPGWADSYMGCEVYSNMYTMDTQLKLQGKTRWAFNGEGRVNYENHALLPLYEDYFSGEHSPYSFVDGSRNGLDYFYLLQHYYPDYMAKVGTLYREELYNKTLPFDGKEFLPYAMAKIYHVNILPSLEIWGENLTDQKLIKYIVDNSNKSIGFLVYNNDSFDKYKGISLKPTMLLPKQEGNDVVLTGIANPNSVIRAEYNGKTYKVTCGSDSKFTIKIPVSDKGEIRVTAQTPGKAISPVTIINSNLSEYLNKKTLSIDGYAGVIATLSLNTDNNTLNFYSTGQTPTGYSVSKTYKYLTISILNPDREVLQSVTVQSRQSLNKYQKLFNGMKYKNGDIIQVTVPDSVYGAKLILNNLNNLNEKVNSFEYDNQHVYNILINDNKLVEFNPPSINNLVTGSNEISGNGTPGTKVTINIGKQNYSTVVNSKGEYILKLPNKLKFGETVTAYTEVGDYKSLPNSEKVEGIAENKIIMNNIWNQPLGVLSFNTDSMEININKGWSRVNPYLKGEAFSIGLYNKDGKLIKSLSFDGGEWPENELGNAFNNLPYQYGDKIFIDYKTNSKISISNLVNDGKLNSSYKVDKPSVFQIEPQGLVYLGDSIKDTTPVKGNVDVSTVYENGKPVESTKYNYTETGDVNTAIKNESIPSLENYHIDYVTVNGVKTPLDKLPKDYSNGTTDIVYHMAENAEYKLNIDVKTESGQVLSTVPTASHFAGDKISVDDSNWNKKEYKLDYILVDGVKTPADKLPEVMPNKNLNITYIVSPIAKSTITVEAMVDGKVLGKPVVTTNYEGEAYKETAPTWDNNDYELKDITVNGVKTSEADLPKVFGDKDVTIVYNLSPKMMNVGERVVNQNGDVLYHNEYKLPFNTSIVNIEDKIPSNYKLENITVSNPNNKDLMLIANKDLNTYKDSNDVKVAFNGEVVSYNVVPINGEITYETQIGNEEPTNVVKEVGQVDTKSKEYKLDIPKGYEVESITVNGKKVDLVNDLDYKNEKQVVVYHLAKIPSNSITETMITNTGKILIPTKTVKTAEENTKVDVNGLTVPAGYKLEKVTIDGKEVKAADNYKVEIGKDITSIVYVVEQIPSTKPVVKPDENHKAGNTDNKPVVNHNDENKPSTDKNDSKSTVKPDENHEAGNTDNKPVVNHNDESKPSADKNDSKPAVKPAENHETGNTDNKPVVNHNDENKPSTDKNDSKSTVKPAENHETGNTDNKPVVNHNDENKPSADKHEGTKVAPVKVEHGEVIVKVIDQNGKVIEEATHTGVIGAKFNPIVIPSKDKLINVTVNGNTVSENNIKNEIVSDSDTNNKTTIIYNVEVPEHEAQKAKPVVTGKVIIKVVDQNGKVIENAEHEGAIGTKFNPIQIPNNYKVINVTVDGTNVDNVPDVIEENSNNNTTTIIYNVNIPENKNNTNGSSVNSNDKTHGSSIINNDKNNSTNTDDNNTKPVATHNENNPSNSNKKNVTKDGNVKIEVIADNGRVVYSSNSNEAVGSTIESVKIPSGYHIDNVTATVNNESVNEVPTKVVKGDIVIIYHVSKVKKVNPEPAKVENGTLKIEIITNDGKILSDSSYTEPVGSDINTVNIPNGYKLQLVSATVNGNKMQAVPTKVEKGETTIVYNVVADQPVVKHNDNNTDKHSDANPVENHSDNNTDKHSDANPVENHSDNNTDKHSDANPVVNHNDNNTDKHSDVKPVENHNDNNTDKHSDAKPVENHNDNNTDKHSDVKPVENHNDNNIDKHSAVKPVINHNNDNTDKHSDVKPVINHNNDNTDKHSDVKPVINHNDNNTDKHSDANPVVNHNDNNTDKHSDVKPVENHNDNNTDKHSNVNSVENYNNSNSESTNKGKSGETVTKAGLPDTGLNNTENDLGLLAGIMAAIAAIGIFRRKK